MRTAVIAEKVGMMGLFQENGDQVPVTVLKIECIFYFKGVATL